MPKDNNSFFKQKKIRSEVKDELLGCYMVSYFTKILSMSITSLYVDSFVGKNKFNDGNPILPLTAFQSLYSILLVYREVHPPVVNMKFIELNHYQDIEAQIPNRHRSRCGTIGGSSSSNAARSFRKRMVVSNYGLIKLKVKRIKTI